MAIAKGKTKVLTESGVISTAGKSARVWTITLIPGTDSSSIIINDGGSGGTERWKLTWAGVTAAGDASVSISFKVPIICTTDAYGTLAGTDASAYIHYDEIED